MAHPLDGCGAPEWTATARFTVQFVHRGGRRLPLRVDQVDTGQPGNWAAVVIAPETSLRPTGMPGPGAEADRGPTGRPIAANPARARQAAQAAARRRSHAGFGPRRPRRARTGPPAGTLREPITVHTLHRASRSRRSERQSARSAWACEALPDVPSVRQVTRRLAGHRSGGPVPVP